MKHYLSRTTSLETPRRSLLKLSARAVLPGLVVLLAVAMLAVLDESTLATITGHYALVVYGAGGVLAAVFHRSRVVAGLLGLAYLDLAFVDVPGAAGRFVPLVTIVVALLGALALTRDRGVRSRAGLAQLAACTALVVLAHVLAQNPVALVAFNDVRMLPSGWSARAGLPEATLFAGAASLAITSRDSTTSTDTT